MPPISRTVAVMPIAILAAVIFGCTDRADLAPVWTGYQNLNEAFPPAPSAPSVAARHEPPALRRQPPPPAPAPAPAPAIQHPAPAKTLPRSARRQPFPPAANPRAASRTAKHEHKVTPASAPPPALEKNKPESGTAKPARQKPAANRSAAAPAGMEKDDAQLHFGWPLAGNLLKNYAQTGRKGIKIAGKKGQAVRAAERGKVVYSGQGLIGYGNLLIIKHKDQYLTAYANNNALLAKEGDVVEKGQEIATVGVGASRKAMLHFEIRKQGKSVNPLTLLPK